MNTSSSFLARELSPSGLGARSGMLTALCVVSLVAAPFLLQGVAQGPELGETGRNFLLGLEILLALGGFTCAALWMGLRDVGQVASRLDVTAPGWRPTAVAIAIIALLCQGVAWLGFLKMFLTLGEMSGPYGRSAMWLGIPLIIPVEVFTTADFVTSIFLLCGAATAATAYYRSVTGVFEASLPAEAFGLFTAGLLFVSLDEYLTIHEFLGGNVPWLRDSTLVAHPDDLVVAGYGVLTVLLFARYVPELMRDKGVLVILGLGVLLQGLASACDMMLPPTMGWIEESLEILGAGTYWLLMVHLSTRETRRVSATTSEPENGVQGALMMTGPGGKV